jgi:hypothetical protein
MLNAWGGFGPETFISFGFQQSTPCGVFDAIAMIQLRYWPISPARRVAIIKLFQCSRGGEAVPDIISLDLNSPSLVLLYCPELKLLLTNSRKESSSGR